MCLQASPPPSTAAPQGFVNNQLNMKNFFSDCSWLRTYCTTYYNYAVAATAAAAAAIHLSLNSLTFPGRRDGDIYSLDVC
jgi:hypothetical protein